MDINPASAGEDMAGDVRQTPFSLETKASDLNRDKISAFQVAPTRKNVFDKSREDAQRKAERDAAETAAALEEFEAEYGSAESASRKRRRDGAWNKDNFSGKRFDHAQHRPDTSRGKRQARGETSLFPDESSEEETPLKPQMRSQGYSQREADDSKDDRNGRFKQDQPAPRQHIDLKAATAIPKRPIDEAEDESGDDVDYYRTKSFSIGDDEQLNQIHRKKLDFLIDDVTARRGTIARLSAFAMTHASAVNEISEEICCRVVEPQLEWKNAVARLWCISDILHNSWTPIPNVWKYRGAFEIRLVKVMTALKNLGDAIESRIRRENFRRLVSGVLTVWSSWICFTAGVVEKLYEAFDDRKEVEEENLVIVKPQKKSGGWKRVDVPSDHPSTTLNESEDLKHEDRVTTSEQNIDLDGEDIDLDGEAIDLDMDMEMQSESNDGLKSSDSNFRSISEPIPGLMKEGTTSSTLEMPKIKLSFGTIKAPLAAISPTPLETPLQQPQHLTSEAPPSSTEHQTELKHANTEVRAVSPLRRPPRRSAADFMD